MNRYDIAIGKKPIIKTPVDDNDWVLKPQSDLEMMILNSAHDHIIAEYKSQKKSDKDISKLMNRLKARMDGVIVSAIMDKAYLKRYFDYNKLAFKIKGDVEKGDFLVLLNKYTSDFIRDIENE